jgi:hypothetical protein
MFSKLTNFGIERTSKQAFGFYIAYFFLIVLGCGISGALFADDFKSGTVVGQRASCVLCLMLCITVCNGKRNWSFKAYVMIALSGVLGVVLGALGGCIPIAYMTTQKNNLLKRSTDKADDSEEVI